MYAKGLGVPQDHAEALMWFRPLAEQGDAAAQFSLGQMYDNGLGVPQDHAETVKWYRAAAEQGDADAQLNLGLMYANGLGVPQDDVQALKWIILSVQHGDATAQTKYFYFFFEKPLFQWRWGRSEAEKALDIVTKQLTPAQIAEAERMARDWKPGD